MTENEALAKMYAPGQYRPSKPYRGGVIQIHVTRACDQSCYNCTQGSNLGGKTTFMPPDKFELALKSLEGYFGVVGVFGGNPALSPHFEEYCRLIAKYFPFEQRGLWCNNPAGKGKIMRATFDPRVSNLNVHLSRSAYDEFKRDWPECNPCGLNHDSRHSPVFVAMKDVLRKECPGCDGEGSQMYQWAKTRCVQTNGRKVAMSDGGWYYVTGDGLEIEMKTIGGPCRECGGTREVYDKERAWELISNCDINSDWSSLIGMFRGELRAWFCEIAGAQSMLHQWDKCKGCNGAGSKSEQMAVEGGYTHTDDRKTIGGPCSECGGTGHAYPDTGLDPTLLYEDPESDYPPSLASSAHGERWWKLDMMYFVHQVRKHCHDCGVPLKGYGELAQRDDNGTEQCSAIHADIYKPKRKGRKVEVVNNLIQLGTGRIEKFTHYLQNSRR